MPIKEPTRIAVLQSGATTNNNGQLAEADGVVGALQLEVAETNGGTATLTVQGSFDGTNWYSVGYYTVDGQPTLTRAVAGIGVTANSRHVYQLLDPYPLVRAVISAVAGGATLTVKLYMVPS